MCVWDMDLRCSLSIFPAQSHHFHRFAEFSLCCDAMSNRASHWGLATCAVTFGHVLRLSPVRASPCGKAALQRLSTACRDLGRLPSTTATATATTTSSTTTTTTTTTAAIATDQRPCQEVWRAHRLSGQRRPPGAQGGAAVSLVWYPNPCKKTKNRFNRWPGLSDCSDRLLE